MASSIKTFLGYLEIHYGKKVQEWEGQYHDDRQLFCNIYNMLVAAYHEMDEKNIQSNFIWHGLHEQRKLQEETLKDIMQRFENRQ
ncbi:hypothetical protein M7775_14120 [Sporomusa sphaeroides DSM 2875]|uniref:hypothetical protein n=1 Tax=Sporomusa sphaeroides TaxID=47679 RepID=UPI00202F94D2|nr:hypothetical protein [Sporomusa sphaeroides]MCM0759692.1 hypothetical protein [Sporomusa sphaeroides DSM 2875]